MKFIFNFKEIFYLVIFFTLLALYFDIYGEKHVLLFIINHLIALLIALLISKLIYTVILKLK
jgi:hypothetical protein